MAEVERDLEDHPTANSLCQAVPGICRSSSGWRIKPQICVKPGLFPLCKEVGLSLKMHVFTLSNGLGIFCDDCGFPAWKLRSVSLCCGSH